MQTQINRNDRYKVVLENDNQYGKSYQILLSGAHILLENPKRHFIAVTKLTKKTAKSLYELHAKIVKDTQYHIDQGRIL